MGWADRLRDDQEVMDRKALLMQMKQARPGPAEEGTPATPPPDVKTKEEKGMPGTGAPAGAPPAPTSPSSGFDGSGYGSWSGYLQAANNWFNPQLRAAKNEAEAKSLQQGFLESLVPELQKRGANIGKIKNEAITIDGREYDTIRDIGGLSEAQMMELGLPSAGSAVPGMGMGAGMAGIGGGIGSSSDAVAALTQGSTYEELLRRIQELNGPEAMDRNALLALMKR